MEHVNAASIRWEVSGITINSFQDPLQTRKTTIFFVSKSTIPGQTVKLFCSGSEILLTEFRYRIMYLYDLSSDVARDGIG